MRLSAAALLTAGMMLLSCKGMEHLPDIEGVQVHLYGGRERILCKWENVPEGIRTIRFTFPDGEAEAPVSTARL